MNQIYKTVIRVVCVAAVAVALWGCRSHKSAVGDMPREMKAVASEIVPLGRGESSKVAKAIAKSYYDWDAISIDGKVNFAGLPVKPSAKIYMRKGDCVRISLRVPLMGEVGRIELDSDTLRAYNKMKRTYCAEYVGGYFAQSQTSIKDVQDLLLGRVFLIGSGTLDASLAQKVDVAEHTSSEWIITPVQQPSGASYGFTVYRDGKMQLASLFSDDDSLEANVIYAYPNKGTDVEFGLRLNGHTFTLDLSYSDINRSPAELTPLQINSSWTKMSLRQLIKSF